MLHLFELTGEPTEKHCLLMNGDLVDRGSWSIEVILTALAWKCQLVSSAFPLSYCLYTDIGLYPHRMFINRGNHETREMNRTYGFEGEAKHKHGEQTYKLFAHVFTVSTSLSPSSDTPSALADMVMDTSAPCYVDPSDEETYRSVVKRDPVAGRQETLLCRAWRAVQQRWRHVG